jgi:hypothetical protein
MPDKPSYLGLLNAIAVAETRACEYLNAWIAVTPSADVAGVLRTVAAREGEHGMTFAKRIDELGFQVRWKDDPEQAKRLELVGSAECSDLEKMKALGLHRLDTGTKPDIFDKVFEDHSIDIRTGELLGRYIAEERDSGRRLRACYQQLKAQAKADGSDAVADRDRLDAIEGKLDAVCRAVEELRQIVCAQSMPATG